MKYQHNAMQDIKWLQTITRLPILLKGVITAEDGNYLVSVIFNATPLNLIYGPIKHSKICSSTCYWMRCCWHYYVQPRGPPARLSSCNHQLPGRGMQINYRHVCTAAKDISGSWPDANLLWQGKFQVVREAKGRVPVFLDSGVRRGTDVFKALALGASGVFVSPLLDYSFWTMQECFLTCTASCIHACPLSDRKARTVRPCCGGQGWGEECTADAEGWARDHHGAERLHVAERYHPRSRYHWERPSLSDVGFDSFAVVQHWKSVALAWLSYSRLSEPSDWFWPLGPCLIHLDSMFLEYFCNEVETSFYRAEPCLCFMALWDNWSNILDKNVPSSDSREKCFKIHEKKVPP